MSTTPLIVFCTWPDDGGADELARSLVGDGLAACVNIGAPARSVYRWQGAIETAEELPLIIKTTEHRYPALEAAIRARHPYEVPEILAVPVARGLDDYLNWVRKCTASC